MASAVGPNGYSQQGDNTQGYNPTSTQQQTGSPSQPPDQVGWYFVESYYTTLNKTPERLAVRYPSHKVLWKQKLIIIHSYFTISVQHLSGALRAKLFQQPKVEW